MLQISITKMSFSLNFYLNKLIFLTENLRNIALDRYIYRFRSGSEPRSRMFVPKRNLLGQYRSVLTIGLGMHASTATQMYQWDSSQSFFHNGEKEILLIKCNGYKRLKRTRADASQRGWHPNPLLFIPLAVLFQQFRFFAHLFSLLQSISIKFKHQYQYQIQAK